MALAQFLDQFLKGQMISVRFISMTWLTKKHNSEVKEIPKQRQGSEWELEL